MHGGGPKVAPGKPLDEVYSQNHPELVEKGAENLVAHIETVKKSGISPVVCINHFYTDNDEEIAAIKRTAEAAGARVAVSKHWEKGGEGARELAEVVTEACEETHEFKFLYDETTSQKKRIELIAKEVYGADGVEYTPEAEAKLKKVQDNPELANMGICMAKTQLSLSHDPELKGRPKGWTLPIKDVYVYQGAELIVPVAGGIKLMPGTASDPAYRQIDVNTETGAVTGLF